MRHNAYVAWWKRRTLAIIVFALGYIFVLKFVLASGPPQEPIDLSLYVQGTSDPLDFSDEIPPPRLLIFGDGVTQGCCDGLHFGYRYWIWEALRHSSVATFQMVGQHSCLAYRVSSNETRCDKPSPNISSHYADVPDFLASGAAYAGGDLAIDMFVDDLESAFWLYRPDVVILQIDRIFSGSFFLTFMDLIERLSRFQSKWEAIFIGSLPSNVSKKADSFQLNKFLAELPKVMPYSHFVHTTGYVIQATDTILITTLRNVSARQYGVFSTECWTESFVPIRQLGMANGSPNELSAKEGCVDARHFCT